MIVLGGHVQALGIIRIFGEAGIHSIVIDKTARNIARHSRYCIGFIKVKDDQLFSYLIEIGAKGSFKGWHIFPTNDFHLKILSQNKKQLSEYFNVAVDEWSVVKGFFNKKESYQMVSELDIPIPFTSMPKNESDVQAFNGPFPCIIKPAVMHTFYAFTKKKVFFCKNKNELIKYYELAKSYIPSDEILIQEIIPGLSDNQFSVCFLSIKGKPVISLIACRMRQHPLDFGNATTYAETMENPEILEYGTRILEKTIFTGVCEIEFKKDVRDNKYKFLEVNPRTWKWHQIGALSDSPFLISYYKYLNGETPEMKTSFKTVSFRHTLTDVYVQMLMIFKGISLWRRNIKPQVNAVWDKSDVKPWFFEKLYFIDLVRTR